MATRNEVVAHAGEQRRAREAARARPTNPELIQVLFRAAGETRYVLTEVPLHARTDDVIAWLHGKQLCGRPEMVRLLFNGRQLAMDTTFADNGISKGDVVEVRHLVLGGAHTHRAANRTSTGILLQTAEPPAAAQTSQRETPPYRSLDRRSAGPQ